MSRFRTEHEPDEKLYMVRYDSINYCVQAKSMTEAIEIWKEHCAELPEHGWDGTEEPEQVVEIHDDPVITRRKKEA